MDTNIQENYISLEETAVYLGVKPATLRSWIKDPNNVLNVLNLMLG